MVTVLNDSTTIAPYTIISHAKTSHLRRKTISRWKETLISVIVQAMPDHELPPETLTDLHEMNCFKHNSRKSLFSFYSKIGRIYPQLYWNIMRNVCFETTFTSWERLHESDMLILTFKHLHVCLQNTKRNKNKTRLCGQNHIMYTPINEIHHFNSLKQILVYLFFKQSAALSRDLHNSQSRHL